MDISRPVPMYAISRVMRLWSIWRKRALALTTSDIDRVGWDGEAVSTLCKWKVRLTEDAASVVDFSRNSSWSEDELNAIRALWRSRKILAAACDEKVELIRQYQDSNRRLSERVDLYLHDTAVQTEV